MGGLTSPWWESYAYHWPETVQGNMATGGNVYQLALLPIWSPMNGRSILLNYHFSNSTANAATVWLWDALTSANDPTGFSTAGNRGGSGTAVTANAGILRINLPPSGDAIHEAHTRPYFQCGIMGTSSQNNTFYSLQIAHLALG